MNLLPFGSAIAAVVLALTAFSLLSRAGVAWRATGVGTGADSPAAINGVVKQ